MIKTRGKLIFYESAWWFLEDKSEAFNYACTTGADVAGVCKLVNLSFATAKF